MAINSSYSLPRPRWINKVLAHLRYFIPRPRKKKITLIIEISIITEQHEVRMKQEFPLASKRGLWQFL